MCLLVESYGRKPELTASAGRVLAVHEVGRVGHWHTIGDESADRGNQQQPRGKRPVPHRYWLTSKGKEQVVCGRGLAWSEF